MKHEHQSGIDGKERLLIEARGLFLERGYAEVSMQEIASAADMTKGAPYYHFRDKEDLFVHVFRREMQLLTEALSERLASATNFRDRLLAVVTSPPKAADPVSGNSCPSSTAMFRQSAASPSSGMPRPPARSALFSIGRA